MDRLRKYHFTDERGKEFWREDDILEDFGDEYAENLEDLVDENNNRILALELNSMEKTRK